MIQPLNYCRQFLKSFDDKKVRFMESDVPGLDWVKNMHGIIEALIFSNKFILPENAECCPDEEFRAVVDCNNIRQPYPVIALEYRFDKSYKCILLSIERELKKDSPFYYPSIVPILGHVVTPWWTVLPIHFGTHIVDLEGPNGAMQSYGDISPKARTFFSRTGEIGSIDNFIAISVRNYYRFMNMCQCSNVEFAPAEGCERGEMKKRRSLGFDEYKVMMVSSHIRAKAEARGGSHASPREHLRRGHIRRIDDERRVWVNATVVCPGSSGKIEKDYAIKGS